MKKVIDHCVLHGKIVKQMSGDQKHCEDKFYGGLAQMGEHLPCKQGVMSSNLIISTQP